MEPFLVHILGCGSALPTLRHNPAAQVIDAHGRLFLIDCGEGTQRAIRKQHIPLSRLDHVFISHLHGDHCFGLPGLLTTLSMLGKRGEFHIHAFPALQEMLAPLLAFHMHGSELRPVFHSLSEQGRETVYEDKALTISTLPLRHRVPCVAFVVREKQPLPHIRRDMIDFLSIPHHRIMEIKQGAGWTADDGTVYSHERLVTPAREPRTYVYMSDTLPCPEHAGAVSGADLLYHEATFAEDKADRARETFHSTASQAADFARAASVKQLLIGHYSARYQDEDRILAEARALFPQTTAAQEGMTLAL